MAPKPKSKEEIEEIFKPTMVRDMDTEYRAKEETNLKYVVSGDDEDDETDENDH